MQRKKVYNELFYRDVKRDIMTLCLSATGNLKGHITRVMTQEITLPDAYKMRILGRPTLKVVGMSTRNSDSSKVKVQMTLQEGRKVISANMLSYLALAANEFAQMKNQVIIKHQLYLHMLCLMRYYLPVAYADVYKLTL
jgi:hypothetical protein